MSAHRGFDCNRAPSTMARACSCPGPACIRRQLWRLDRNGLGIAERLERRLGGQALIAALRNRVAP
jgi:hypothetical protein